MTQDLEELAQTIEDEAYQIATFNEELEIEIANIRADIRGVLGVLRRRTAAGSEKRTQRIVFEDESIR